MSVGTQEVQCPSRWTVRAPRSEAIRSRHRQHSVLLQLVISEEEVKCARSVCDECRTAIRTEAQKTDSPL